MIRNRTVQLVGEVVREARIFLRRLLPHSRGIPTFIVAGAQRSGTTSLYSYLIQHPQIIPGLCKEVHYFDIRAGRSRSWYLSHFPRLSALEDSKITGEASPYYMFHPSVFSRLYDFNRNLKLIMILRNPIDRAISHYFHEVKLGMERLTFMEALEREEDRLRGEEEKLISEPSYRSFSYQHYSYKKRGIYVEQLKRCFRYFDMDQVLILKAGDLFQKTSKTLERVMRFLDVPVMHLPHNSKRKNRGNYAPVVPNIRAHLDAYFAPFNEELHDLLERDFGW